MRLSAAALLAALLAGLAGCAAQQRVPVRVEPAPAEVYVDGKRAAADGASEALSLRVDRSHVVLIRRAGFRTEQVVVESVLRNGVRRLEPDAIAVTLAPEQSRGRKIEVELDAVDAESPAAVDPTGDAP